MGKTRGEVVIERDNQLWVLHLRGSGADREAALSELRALLLSGLRKMWAGRECADDALLEDAVQNTLVQILRKLETYQGKARFLTWATTVAVHAVVTEMRRRRWADVSLEAMVRPADFDRDQADQSLSPGVQAARSEVLGLLNRLIREALTERQRTVLLSELNGIPLEEIARRLGTNRNSVYKLAHDARRSLKAKLESSGYVSDEIAELWANPQGGKFQ